MDVFLQSSATARVASLGIHITADVCERARQLAGERDIIELSSVHRSSDLVDAWLSFLNTKTTDDELSDRAIILLLSMFIDAFRRNTPWSASVENDLRTRKALTGQPFSLSGCWFEARRKLAGRLFHFGRRGTITAEKQAALKACIAEFNALVAIDAAARRPDIRQRYLGMRGVAALFLGRFNDAPLPFYQMAATDLEEATTLGDHTAQHYEYLIEAYLHQNELAPSDQILARAAVLVEDALRFSAQTRGLTCLAGLFAILEGGAHLQRRDRMSASSSFVRGIRLFDAALRLPPHRSFADDYLRLNRSAARVRLIALQIAEGDPDQTLSDAIDELRDIRARDHDGTFRSFWLPAALIKRAHLRNKADNRGSALEDVSEAETYIFEANSFPESVTVRRQAELARHEIELNLAVDRADVQSVVTLLQWWQTHWSPTEHLPVPALALGLRWLSTTAEDAWAELVPSVTSLLCASAAREGESPSASRFALSHAANALRVLAKRTGTSEMLRESYLRYVSAIDADTTPASPEVYAYAGEVALRLAKHRSEENESQTIGYLEDAAKFLSVSVEQQRTDASTQMTKVVASSRAGEAYARLYSFTNDSAHAIQAIAYLSDAMALGNRTAQLIGLLGDVYFRRGRFRRDVDDLANAIRLKREARSAENASAMENWRENRSVVASAAFHLWKIDGDPRHLSDAVIAAAESVVADPFWAWPLLQLPDVANCAPRVRKDARAATVAPVDGLAALAFEGRTEELLLEACRIAVENRTEFRLDHLSGRQVVYSFADPHRLLSSALVVKETAAANATRELQTIDKFGAFLRKHSSPWWMRLPEPLSVSEQGNKTIYVMRRAPGVELGVAVLDKTRRDEDSLPLVKKAVSFLGWYHAWRGLRPYASSASALIDATAAAVHAIARQLQSSSAVADELQRRSRSLVDVALPLVAKKDAHAENWIVTPDSQIVMIDLEAKASTLLPLLYEVAQLIEDQGLLSCDSTGWEHREEIVRDYMAEVRRLAHLSDKATREASIAEYAVFALVRAMVNFPAIVRRNINRTSESSVVRAREHRAKHYLDLIQSVRDRFRGHAVGDLAKLIGDEVRRHEEDLRRAAAGAGEDALPQPSLPPTSLIAP